MVWEKMKRFFAIIYFIGFLNILLFSHGENSKNITLEIINVIKNGGTVYVSIYSNEQYFKNMEPDISLVFEADNTIISHTITLPYGEYAITMYQDANNNRQIDLGLFGIPKELFGMSNYSGRGFPSNNFNKLKIFINDVTEKITVGLYRL
jgi:uncharacterized protein (DUF2141 family)